MHIIFSPYKNFLFISSQNTPIYGGQNSRAVPNPNTNPNPNPNPNPNTGTGAPQLTQLGPIHGILLSIWHNWRDLAQYRKNTAGLALLVSIEVLVLVSTLAGKSK